MQKSDEHPGPRAGGMDRRVMTSGGLQEPAPSSSYFPDRHPLTAPRVGGTVSPSPDDTRATLGARPPTGTGQARGAGTAMVMTDVWTKREAGPLAVYCHEGSYAYEHCDAVLERY